MGRRFLAAALLALALPAAALGAVDVKSVDAADYPRITLAVVTGEPTSVAPKLTESGSVVAGLTAENLGRAKSIVLALDRSQSMRGKPLEDAVAAARAFLATKPPADRVALVGFGSTALALTDFSTATIDADSALRNMGVDGTSGTALYDALAVSARALSAEPLEARVVILLTDGRDASSTETLAAAIGAARRAGAAVYPIAIESPQFSPADLEQMANRTGGTYYGAASSDALKGAYGAITEELKRTWRLEYVTAARPGEKLELEAKVAGETAKGSLRVPGEATGVTHAEPSKLIPRSILEGTGGTLIVALAVGFIVLLAAAVAFASRKGAWVRARLAPHVTKTPAVRRRRGEKERLALASGLFLATERAFGELRQWKMLQRLLERADVPLRTVEFVYVMAGSGFGAGILAAFAGLPGVVILGVLAGGAFVPVVVVSFMARRRLKAFENQLPDILVAMAASLKAGHSFRQGIQAVVDEGVPPASKEFKRVLTETRLGRPMDQALAEMSERVGSKNFEFVISAVTIQRQIGGSLAGLFDMVADTVRQRQQFKRKIKGLTAMGRASAYVLIGLPFFVLGAVTLANSEYMAPLYHTHTGQMLMLTGVGMIAVGSLFLWKIVSFKG